VVVIEGKEDKEVVAFTKQTTENANQILVALRGVEITDTSSYQLANDLLKQVVSEKKRLVEREKWVLNPLEESVKRLKALFLQPKKALLNAETVLKSSIAAYKKQQEEEAQKKMLQAASSDNHHEIRGLVALAAEAVPVTEGVSTYETWTFEVEDPLQVPREFLTVDEVLVRAYVKKNKHHSQIPGIRVFTKTTVAVRG
jgi:predicted house-cleaning NTP pyrophosphatase (Maf/HAM1 superfamily)